MNGGDFEILGKIMDFEGMAIGRAIRELPPLRRLYGRGRGRKMKARATVRPLGGHVRDAEVHWYEAHGIGKRDFKIKEP